MKPISLTYTATTARTLESASLLSQLPHVKISLPPANSPCSISTFPFSQRFGQLPDSRPPRGRSASFEDHVVFFVFRAVSMVFRSSSEILGAAFRIIATNQSDRKSV